MDDIAGGAWLATPRLDPVLRTWLGPAAESARNAPVVRQPGAIPTAVAMTGYVSLQADKARDFFRRPGVRFVPLDGGDVEIAVATRAGDERPAVAALRRAVHFARAAAAADRNGSA